MPVDHREIAFEQAIEGNLLNSGFLKVDRDAFNKELGFFPSEVLSFLKETQSRELIELEKLHKSSLDGNLLNRLGNELNNQGTLSVIRHGFKFDGKTIRMAFFAPATGLNPETLALFQNNRLSITRQLKYSLRNEKSIDLVLSLNGLPIATAELKNPMTGQTVEDAKKQYQNDRDPRELIFQFNKRTIVHFAVDPDEVYLTTRLKGKETSFLPFNKGKGTGAGNPDNPAGYKTAYLWEQIWQKDSWLEILARYVHIQKEEVNSDGKKIIKETMIFPRYHQLDVVRKLEIDVQKSGVGKNYLIEHSAGSGKSNSIAWLAHRMSTFHDKQDRKIFDTVIVITDRTVLDRQLQDTIYQIEHKQGVVQKIDESSAQLADAIISGAPIIITTLQKFPFVTEKTKNLPEKKYAVIVDEAHSSQSGEMTTKMKSVLAAKSLEEAAKEEAESPEDYQEEIIKIMRARAQLPNLSFFAFTATPKAKTLEVFGSPGPDGKPRPFHLYSMRQAIEEQFILDVLKNYTTYKTYYKLVKAIEDDPKVSKKKAAQALARFMSLHPHNLAQKTEVMVEHFRNSTRSKIGGQAKAMVVTASRLHAVRYKQEIDKYLKEKGYTDIKTLVAFSGTVRDELGLEFNEVEMNRGIKEKELPEKFGGGEYQVLIVAEKYQTGFDQPLLQTMYVDKRLSGIHAVQTLSRLNRIYPGKEDTFILDFVNTGEEIQRAFQPYYENCTVEERADLYQLYSLMNKLNDYQIYHLSEIETFSKIFFKPRENQTTKDHGLLNAALDPAVDRFNAVEPEKQELFKKDLISYVRLYSFLSQIIPFQDPDLEKLYVFSRFLLNKLPKGGRGKITFGDEIALKYYRLEKTLEGSISLSSLGEGVVRGPQEVGTGAEKDQKIELSKIIKVLNDRFGTDFKPADALFLEQVKEDALAKEELVQVALANDDISNFGLVFKKVLEGIFIDRMDQNSSIFEKFMENKEFQKVVSDYLTKQVYEGIRNPPKTGS